MIKSILNKLCQYQKKKNNIEESLPKHNTVTFWVEANQSYAKIYIVDTDPESIDSLAEMLFGINSGEYMTSLLNILIDISKQDPKIKHYVKEVMVAWQDLVDDNTSYGDTTEPYIKPTAFSNGIKHNDKP